MTRAYFYVESDRAVASTFVFHARHHKVLQSVPTTCARQQSHSATFLPASFSLNRQTRFFLTSTGKTLGTRRINPTIVFRMGERRNSAKCRGKRENPYRFQTHFFARSGMDLTLGKSLARRKALDNAVQQDRLVPIDQKWAARRRKLTENIERSVRPAPPRLLIFAKSLSDRKHPLSSAIRVIVPRFAPLSAANNC